METQRQFNREGGYNAGLSDGLITGAFGFLFAAGGDKSLAYRAAVEASNFHAVASARARSEGDEQRAEDHLYIGRGLATIASVIQTAPDGPAGESWEESFARIMGDDRPGSASLN